MFEEADYDYLKGRIIREPELEDPYWWEEDEIVYLTDDEDELDWSNDTLDCGCCACCGCSCYELEEEEQGYTFIQDEYDADLPYIYLSVYFNHTLGEDLAEESPRNPIVELEGCWGDYDYNEEDFIGIFEELPRFLAKTLGYGGFECLVQAEVEYFMCNHPLDPEEWDAQVFFEIIDWRRVNE